MQIHSVKLENYKSIVDTGLIDLDKSINIFAGKNNTGKTALIEALFYVANAEVGKRLPSTLQHSNLQVEISVNNSELDILNRGMQTEYCINQVNKFNIHLSFLKENISFLCINKIEVSIENSYLPLYTNQSSEREKYLLSLPNGRGTTFSGRPEAINNFITLLREKLVFISGSRHVPKNEDFNHQQDLSIDGTNLNAFMFTLHNNHEEVFDEIVKVFKKIFNDVTSITTPIDGDGNTFISLRFEGNSQDIPLSNCGSGFTHVLILLCVLFTKENSVILFDEPHVFLHPSAEKAIYDLISNNGKHQYLLTTHSPLLINYPFPKKIYLVQKENGESTYSKLDNMQEILSDIGLNNSDYALADKVLFVEGETEEAIIPLILSHFGMKQIGYNYKILKMKGTGNEFTKKTAMTRNNEKLQLVLGGVSNSVIPYKILIDRDEKSDEKLQEIKDKYGDNIVILSRREIENYFIDSYEELSEVINEETGTQDSNVSNVESEVNVILSNHQDKKVFPKGFSNPLNEAVGSEVLERLFSNYQLSYKKVEHGERLTQLILKKNPEKFEFLTEQLGEFFSKT